MSIQGTLSGTDSFVANGMLTLTQTSALSTTGSVDAYGGMELDGDNYITATTLNNHGAATWGLMVNGGNSALFAGAIINNLAGASFTIAGSGGAASEIGPGDNSVVAFNNAGSLICSAAGGGSASIIVPFTNTGSVSVEQGTLGLGSAALRMPAARAPGHLTDPPGPTSGSAPST